MPAILDEHQSYQDTNGKPLVGGRVFFGVAGSDPTILANKINIFSDRGLTVAATNPQPIDANGQLAVKIFVPGRYSIEVQNEFNAQLFRDLDAGALATIGLSALTNVTSVSNVIAGNADPTITVYVDKAQFVLTLPVASTGGTTLNIDLVGAVPVQSNGAEIQAAEFRENQLVIVAYNASLNVPTGIFEVVNTVDANNNEVFTLFTSSASSTSIIPQDGTPPQITEGLQIMSQVFTPHFADSTIEVEVHVQGGFVNLGGEGSLIAWSIALFRDSVVSALMAEGFQMSSATTVFGTQNGVLSFVFRESAVNTNARTYTVRAGQTASDSFRFGGIFGGSVPHSHIKIKEIRL